MPDERRAGLSDLSHKMDLMMQSMEVNNSTTQEIKNAVMGHNSTPGLKTRVAVNEEAITTIKGFKRADRGFSALMGLVGGFVASLFKGG